MENLKKEILDNFDFYGEEVLEVVLWFKVEEWQITMNKKTMRFKPLAMEIYKTIYKDCYYNIPRANGKITWCRKYVNGLL